MKALAIVALVITGISFILASLYSFSEKTVILLDNLFAFSPNSSNNLFELERESDFFLDLLFDDFLDLLFDLGSFLFTYNGLNAFKISFLTGKGFRSFVKL